MTRGELGIDDEQFVDLLMELIRIPSPSGEEGSLARFLLDRLPAMGWDEVSIDGQHNVVARIRGSGGGPTVLLLSHLDAAGPGTMERPLEPIRLDGAPFGKRGQIVRGRGAVAPKGALAALIAAGSRLRRGAERPAGDIVLAGVARDLFANHDGIRAVHEAGLTADFAIAGEPTENRAVIGARGIARFDVTFRGVPAHAGDPDRGVNPIPLMAAFLVEVERGEAKPNSRGEHPQLGRATLSPLS